MIAIVAKSVDAIMLLRIVCTAKTPFFKGSWNIKEEVNVMLRMTILDTSVEVKYLLLLGNKYTDKLDK